MKRFSLKFLFAASTLVILFAGYSQWRRQNILRQVHEIELLGGKVELANNYRDHLWQRRPTKGRLTIGPLPDSSSAPQAQLTRQKMEALGITDISTTIFW